MIELFLAYQDGTETAAEPSGSFLGLVIMAVAIGAIFYLLLVRPQRKRMQQHQAVVSSLEVGDEVTTIGGIFGIVEHLADDHVLLQVEGGGRLRVLRRAVAGKVES